METRTIPPKFRREKSGLDELYVIDIRIGSHLQATEVTDRTWQMDAILYCSNRDPVSFISETIV
jgi:hypothetical protein